MTASVSHAPAASPPGSVTAVEHLLRARRISCSGRLLDLACDILQAAGASPLEPPAAAVPTVDAVVLDCYQLALERLTAACQSARLPAYVQDPLQEAIELLGAVATDLPLTEASTDQRGAAVTPGTRPPAERTAHPRGGGES